MAVEQLPIEAYHSYIRNNPGWIQKALLRGFKETIGHSPTLSKRPCICYPQLLHPGKDTWTLLQRCTGTNICKFMHTRIRKMEGYRKEGAAWEQLLFTEYLPNIPRRRHELISHLAQTGACTMREMTKTAVSYIAKERQVKNALRVLAICAKTDDGIKILRKQGVQKLHFLARQAIENDEVGAFTAILDSHHGLPAYSTSFVPRLAQDLVHQLYKENKDAIEAMLTFLLPRQQSIGYCLYHKQPLLAMLLDSMPHEAKTFSPVYIRVTKKVLDKQDVIPTSKDLLLFFINAKLTTQTMDHYIAKIDVPKNTVYEHLFHVSIQKGRIDIMRHALDQLQTMGSAPRDMADHAIQGLRTHNKFVIAFFFFGEVSSLAPFRHKPLGPYKQVPLAILFASWQARMFIKTADTISLRDIMTSFYDASMEDYVDDLGRTLWHYAALSVDCFQVFLAAHYDGTCPRVDVRKALARRDADNNTPALLLYKHHSHVDGFDVQFNKQGNLTGRKVPLIRLLSQMGASLDDKNDFGESLRSLVTARKDFCGMALAAGLAMN